MHNQDVEEFLAHVGVKGMKWGQRMRARDAQITSARKKTKTIRDTYDTLQGQSDFYKKYGITSARSKMVDQKLADHVKKMTKQEKDVYVATKMKSGEIAATALLAGAIGGLSIWLNK